MEPLQVEIFPQLSGKLAARINGLVADLTRYQNRDGRHHDIYFADQELQNWLCAYPVRDLGVHFSVVQFWTESLLEDRAGEVRVSFGPSSVLIILNFRLRLLQWNNPWSAMTYAEVIADVGRRHDLSVEGIVGEIAQPNQFLSIFGNARSPGSVLGEEIRHLIEKFRVVEEEAIAQLIAAQHAESLTTTFHFPPAIATACEQYLLYFVQFLADLGIEAQAEVQHAAAEVLFRVTPTEGREALERVREALDAYLRLPSDPSVSLVHSSGQDPAVWELKAVIRHLKDRVELQRDVLEARNERILAQAERIETLQLANYRLQQQAGREVKAIGSGGGQAPPAGEEETESVIEGALSVKRYEIGPVVVEIPEILRMLKRRFGK